MYFPAPDFVISSIERQGLFGEHCGTAMKAFVYKRYGTGDNLELQDVARPVPGVGEVLIKVHSIALNASDWELLRGKPLYARLWGYIRPKIGVLGSDISGRVESVGEGVTRFYPGDEVFADVFGSWGGFAEFVCAREDRLLRKPSSMTFADAAALPQAGVVALQGLRDKGLVRPGKNVLIIGAGGGAGSFAIQLAKLFGATVTGVDSTNKQALMRSLGANNVIDYTVDDFVQSGRQFDLILDFVASHSIFACQRALNPDGVYVLVGGPVHRILQTLIVGPMLERLSGKSFGMLAHRQKVEDVTYLTGLCKAGTLVPAIGKHAAFGDLPAVLRQLGQGEVPGKVVVSL